MCLGQPRSCGLSGSSETSLFGVWSRSLSLAIQPAFGRNRILDVRQWDQCPVAHNIFFIVLNPIRGFWCKGLFLFPIHIHCDWPKTSGLTFQLVSEQLCVMRGTTTLWMFHASLPHNSPHYLPFESLRILIKGASFRVFWKFHHKSTGHWNVLIWTTLHGQVMNLTCLR